MFCFIYTRYIIYLFATYMNIYTQKKTFSSYFISFIGYLYSLLLFFNYPPFSHIHWINSTLPFVLRFNVMHAHIHSPAGSVTFWATWTEIPVHNISNEVVSNSNLENIFTKKTFWTFLLTDETRKAIGIVCVCVRVYVCVRSYTVWRQSRNAINFLDCKRQKYLKNFSI